MTNYTSGKTLIGTTDAVQAGIEAMARQAVDLELLDAHEAAPLRQTTLQQPVSVEGPGTFFGRAVRRLDFSPSANPGWWFDRTDLPGCMPIAVSVHNVWTTARNIVLCSGSPHNYMRMVEHIVALKVGMNLDNVVIRMDSGDPPLFDRGSMDLVEAVERAGIVETTAPAHYVTVREPVSAAGPAGSFLLFLPDEAGSRRLELDVAVDFKSAIGRQRIRFLTDARSFRHGAMARTNTTLLRMLLYLSVGKILADIRNLGYTTRNILIAGPKRYFNEPKLLHNGKSLEAAWHRATLDLLAAIALIKGSRLCGKVISYKAGHTLDVQAIREIHNGDLFVEA